MDLEYENAKEVEKLKKEAEELRDLIGVIHQDIDSIVSIIIKLRDTEDEKYRIHQVYTSKIIWKVLFFSLLSFVIFFIIIAAIL